MLGLLWSKGQWVNYISSNGVWGALKIKNFLKLKTLAKPGEGGVPGRMFS